MDREDIIRIEATETDEEERQLQILLTISVFMGIGALVIRSSLWDAALVTALSAALFGIAWLIIVRVKGK